MQILEFESYQQRAGNQRLVATWLATDRLMQTFKGADALPAWCEACGKLQQLIIGRGGGEPNLREGLVCPECQMNARQRAGYALLEREAPRHASVYVTEQATYTFLAVHRSYPQAVGSEFVPDPVARQRLQDWYDRVGGQGRIQHGDVTALEFADARFDAVLSFDVLEHVPRYEAAFAEFARVLRPGGALIATFPFTDGPTTLIRARVDEAGEVVHLCEPEYHGDPVTGGVLCYYHFGWDVLEVVARSGFRDARMVLAWAPEQGIFYGHWMLLAKR